MFLFEHKNHKMKVNPFFATEPRLSLEQRRVLGSMIEVEPGKRMSWFTRLKQAPGPATLENIRQWSDRLADLATLPDPAPCLQDIAYTKIRQFAAEASAHEISDIRGIHQEARRHTLLLCLLYHTQATTRDELTDMLLRRMRRTQNLAQEQLEEMQEKHRKMEEELIEVLGQVLHQVKRDAGDAVLGSDIRKILADKGGVEALSVHCEAVSAYHHNNYLPLLWPIHRKYRTVLFQVMEALTIESATQDTYLMDALEFIRCHRDTKRDYVPSDIDLSFVSERWQDLVRIKENGRQLINRRTMEVCVFVHVAEALDTGDLYVVGSAAYADYRTQLLPWEECQDKVAAYCESLGLPASGPKTVKALQKKLRRVAEQVDSSFPENSELTIDKHGKPHLKRQKATELPDNLRAFEEEVRSRMPERHLLDILKHVQHWSQFTRHFGPPSGSDTKLPDAVRAYLLTVFGYGCNLGSSQTAKHAPTIINRHTVRRINARHVNTGKLEAGMNDIIAEYIRFDLTSFWGSGKIAIADGTHIKLRENNLMGEQHIRHGAYGGIAYHHISDTYIALFSHFIACGVWEAIYILDALMQNKSALQPDTLHADTHGQSEPVFALAYLLGIKLFPRMRTWNDVAFYHPDKTTAYKHIDSLFTRTIDWKLIETHWQDMMQVVISIQAGKVLPSMLLRKLGSHNRKNKLYRAFRELGRVERTIFLLRYISESEFRHSIRAETTKIESYNDFLDWISFGGPVIKSGNPVEQEKQIKYMNLIANAIMLHNVADLTEVLGSMIAEGYIITKELVACLGPHMRDHILRFGKYVLDMEEKAPELIPKSIPIAVAG